MIGVLFSSKDSHSKWKTLFVRNLLPYRNGHISLRTSGQSHQQVHVSDEFDVVTFDRRAGFAEVLSSVLENKEFVY